MAVVSSRNEPVRALLVTIAICQVAVLIGNVDAIAPLLRYVFLKQHCRKDYSLEYCLHQSESHW